ncbi:rRNA maturation RNase YbeY [Hyphobacterium sp.]|uniref:rRNA maturation RNase YbeY n=1 Tax=Hyphobacterium sp. TaxID=2004662 RepID=UPI003749562D
MAPSFDLIVDAENWPPEDELLRVCEQAISSALTILRIESSDAFCLLFTDDSEMQALNSQFRNKPTATNVLAFPAAESDVGFLGDIALGQETVFREAQEKSIPVIHHIAHLVVHGFLHLQGYDHQTEAEAEQMESLEREALQNIDIADPYQGDQQ